MEQSEQFEARERIINAAIKLFSEKGFDGTRVNEIAAAAKVNKALIYYYFKSKEEILDHVLELLFKDLTGFSMGFIRRHMVKMIAEGKLDILEDRFRFRDGQALNFFMQSIDTYCHQIIDYVIKRRAVFRVLMLESLKQDKRHYNLFRFMEVMEDSVATPLIKMIKDVDSDFNVTEDLVLYKFFFGIIPILSFATFFDDWKESKAIGEKDLRDSFLRCCHFLIQPFICGNDILLKIRPPLYPLMNGG